MWVEWLLGGAAVRKAARSEDRRLANQMMAAWTNFARNGDPNGKSVPHWTPYESTERQTMLWNSKSETCSDPEPEPRTIWESVLQ